MDIDEKTTDQHLLAELGERISQHRVNRNLTQKQLAEMAGISEPTLQRLEYGEVSQLTTLIRILRALKLLGNLDQLIPEPPPSPIQQAKLKGKTRQRASSRKKGKETEKPGEEWSWGEDS